MNRLARGRNAAMSSPLMPVMSGTYRPPVIVVSSFCLKSPPITDGLSVTLEKCLTASATTLSLSPPPQYHRLSVELFPPDEPPEELVPHAAAAAAPVTASAPAWMNRLRDRSTWSSSVY
jgi:hypothetical protein